MDYSFRLLFAFACPCVVLDKRMSSLSAVFFFSTAHVCTCTQHDDTFQQEEYQSTSRLENADEKKFQQEEQSVQEELTPFPSSPAAFVSYLTPICHPGDSPVLCKTTQDLILFTHNFEQLLTKNLLLLLLLLLFFFFFFFFKF